MTLGRKGVAPTVLVTLSSLMKMPFPWMMVLSPWKSNSPLLSKVVGREPAESRVSWVLKMPPVTCCITATRGLTSVAFPSFIA